MAKNYNLQVKCSICTETEIITMNDYELKIHQVMSAAFEADPTKIDPYFRLPNKVISGGKGEVNWQYVPMCKTCRELWTNTVLPNLKDTLNDFRTGGGT